MNLLLDTHVLLWWLADDAALDDTPRAAIADGANVVYVSAATVWEIAIKRSLGKLSVPDDLPTVLETEGFRKLSITWEHAFRTEGLPNIHRDPFDRVLIAQCLVEGLTMVSSDRHIARYGVPLLQA